MTDSISILKTCKKCGEQKANELFTVNSRNGRVKSPCKACALKQSNAWRNKNKEQVNAQAKIRSKSEKSKKQLRERMQRWRLRNPDKKRAESLRWNAKRKELRIQATNEIVD